MSKVFLKHNRKISVTEINFNKAQIINNLLQSRTLLTVNLLAIYHFAKKTRSYILLAP